MIRQLSSLFLMLVLLAGCGASSKIGGDCKEPIITSAICDAYVKEKEDETAVVVIKYAHTGEFGKMHRIVVRGYGEGRNDVIGNPFPVYAIPGIHTVEIPITFIAGSDFESQDYQTDFIRVEFRWVDEARSHYMDILMREDIDYKASWRKKMKVKPLWQKKS